MTTLDYSKITDIVTGNVLPSDYPDFSDAYVQSANYDGRPMTDEEIEELNQDSCFVNEKAHETLY